ncbi:glycosyltransferase family 2 protein [Hymenobacter sp. DG01]|uniref:glycosyltransferase family 2 protein n=1 Tax=Hymenobacter sp. DG01 TaxID=2584940 RepID=UPI0015DDA373|nr:glycosyltransferase family 2 protein [Hymenobacter sp. DG01]
MSSAPFPAAPAPTVAPASSPSATPQATQPLLSICVPTYRRPDLLARALGSLGQLPAEVEVIISDNDAADDLGEQVTTQALAGQLPGTWRYYRNAPGGSAATNWVACIERVRGQYVLMLHDDDYLLSGGLQTVLNALRYLRQQHQTVHAVLFGVSVVDAHERELQRQQPAEAGYLPPAAAVEAVLTDSALVRMPALVVSREAYQHTGGPDPSQRNTDDTDLWLRVFAFGGVHLAPALTAAYSVHEGALTTGVFHEQNIELLQRIFQKARTRQLLPEARLRRAENQFFHQFILAGAYRALRRHDADGARQALRLFQLPSLRHLSTPLRWLPIRWGLGALVRLNLTPPRLNRLSWLRPTA